MSRKPVRPRELDDQDVAAALDYYRGEVGIDIASGFLDAVQAAYWAIAEHPAAGFPRYAHELGLPELRSRALKRFPYLVFYVEREDYIDVWRLLHAERDIPVRMREPGR